MEVQDAIPEVESLPRQSILFEALYQPLWSGEGAALALTLVGAVASTFSIFVVTEVVPPGPEAAQVSVVPVLGALTLIAGSHPVVDVTDPVTDQCTTMDALTYQPLLPGVPSIVYATPGGVSSCATKRASACVGRRKAAARPIATHHEARCNSDLGGEETTL
jgi:hypothetical protein